MINNDETGISDFQLVFESAIFFNPPTTHQSHKSLLVFPLVSTSPSARETDIDGAGDVGGGGCVPGDSWFSGVDEGYSVLESHERVLDLLRVGNCLGNYCFSISGFFGICFFAGFLCYAQHLLAANCHSYLQQFGVGTFYFPLCL